MTTTLRLLLLTVAVLAVGCVSPCHAYHRGDPVSVLQRSQYKGYRTEWAELMAKHAPRFAIDRTIKYNPVDSTKKYKSDQEYKIQLSVDDDRFLTSWISVNSGHGDYLRHLELELIYSGPNIINVKWHVDYHGRDLHGDRPDYIYVQYHWSEYSEIDSSFGLSFLLIVCAAATWVVAVMIVCRFDFKRKGKKAA
eukprot:TRINITY_DN30934_c0_g2_i1.p2 TRINITY_DN30934_c0_g2~~TRINITY_DN30934_c0_g2_i1.p2  ORF type:complete len:202 (-),score=69.10 TRINITY_DN30934_c0_g2_i1:120-701(-)